MPPIPAEQSQPFGGRLVGEPAPNSPFVVDTVVSLKEAASIVGCHPDTLKNQWRRGKIRILRISARRLGIRQSELHRYLSDCEVAA